MSTVISIGTLFVMTLDGRPCRRPLDEATRRVRWGRPLVAKRSTTVASSAVSVDDQAFIDAITMDEG
jgi:hypothetical protein